MWNQNVTLPDFPWKRQSFHFLYGAISPILFCCCLSMHCWPTGLSSFDGDAEGDKTRLRSKVIHLSSSWEWHTLISEGLKVTSFCCCKGRKKMVQRVNPRGLRSWFHFALHVCNQHKYVSMLPQSGHTNPSGHNNLGMTPFYILKIPQVWYSQKAAVFAVKPSVNVSCRPSATSNRMNKIEMLSAHRFRGFSMLYLKLRDLIVEKEDNTFWDWAFTLLQWSSLHVVLYSLKVYFRNRLMSE